MTFYIPLLYFLVFKASAGPKVLISLLYGYVEGHMTLEDFSWTDPFRLIVTSY